MHSIFLKCKSSLTSVQTRTFQTLLNIACVRFTRIFLHSYALNLTSIPQTHTTQRTCYTSVLCIKPSVIQAVLNYWYSVLCTDTIYRLRTVARGTTSGYRRSVSAMITGHIWLIQLFFLPPAWSGRPGSQFTHTHTYIYRMSQEECARLRESVPYVNPKHLYPKLNGYGDNGLRKVGASCGSKYCNLHSW